MTRFGRAPRNSNGMNAEIRDGTCGSPACGVQGDVWACLVCERRTGRELARCRRHYEVHKRTFHAQRRI